VAVLGKKGLSRYYAKRDAMTPYPAVEIRLGKVKHKREFIMKQKERRSRENFMNEDGCEPDNEIVKGEANADAGKVSAELGLIMASTENSKSYGSIVSHLSKTSELQYEVVQEEDGEGENDPQDEKQTVADFAVALLFIYVGVTAFTAGIFSIYTSG